MLRNILCYCLMLTVTLSEAYKILGIFPLNHKSHNVILNALVKGLAERGHKVDVITHLPLKDPPENYNVVVNLDGTLPGCTNNFTIDFVLGMKGINADLIATGSGNNVCDLLALESMQNFIKRLRENSTYDLVITEAFAANCYMGFGNLLNVPVVAVSSAIEYPWVSSFIGNDDNLAYVSIPSMSVFTKMNFWQRLENFYRYHKERYLFQRATEDSQTVSMRKYLSPDIPHIREVERNVALTLVNSYPVVFGIKPVTTGLIHVGGLHVGQENTRLPQKLQKWMDESSQGVVCFTFGSMVLIETLPRKTLEILYDSFSRIKPVRVLMKIDDETKLPPGLPSNVRTLPWFPQEAILAHNNTRAFITHGGLMGCQEALYYGVPMVGVPLFADQARNVATFVAKNMSVVLDVKHITNESLNNALDAVLNNPMYRNYAKYYSKLFRDRPMTAMETAIFWIEYTIRNGPILRSPVLDLSWWELRQFDIFGFLLLLIALVLFTTYFCLKSLVYFCSMKPKKSKTQ